MRYFNGLKAIMIILLFALLPSIILARPQQLSAGDQTPIPIVSASSDIGEDGSLNYSYETGNGIHYQQTAYTKKAPPGDHLAESLGDGEEPVIQVMTGSYSYQAPDGTQINLSYVADENGFQPQGDHLPTPPPIPEAIQRVLNSLPVNDQP